MQHSTLLKTHLLTPMIDQLIKQSVKKFGDEVTLLDNLICLLFLEYFTKGFKFAYMQNSIDSGTKADHLYRHIFVAFC